MSFLELPGDIILKIIDIPWAVGRGKSKQQIRNDYKDNNPYNSLVKVNRSFNKRLSTTDILIPVVASYSDRQMVRYELIYIGRQLDIPDKFLMRHPFPGPGLAIRILGEITKERLKVLKDSDDIFIRLLHETNRIRE